MTRTRHVFFQDAPCLRYAALGDTAVRVIAIHHIIQEYNLDAVVIPQPNATFLPLWQAAIGADRVFTDSTLLPERFSDARVSRPTNLDWRFGSAGWNVFESVMWENGFFRTRNLMVRPPIVFRADHRTQAVMIYPVEKTDGNRVLDDDWWSRTCTALRARGLKINLLGDLHHGPLNRFLCNTKFDAVFPPTIEGLRNCVASSSLAIGGSTGPTWTLLMSDIPQIVIETKRSPHGYWFFDRCQHVLAKRLEVMETLEAATHRFCR